MWLLGSPRRRVAPVESDGHPSRIWSSINILLSDRSRDAVSLSTHLSHLAAVVLSKSGGSTWLIEKNVVGELIEFLIDDAEEEEEEAGRADIIHWLTDIVRSVGGILEHEIVYEPILRLLRISAASDRLETNEGVIHLARQIAFRIRASPRQLLSVFFHDGHLTTQEFPLFVYIIRFVHREGALGDAARSGLLAIFSLVQGDNNSSAGTRDLLRYLLQSEFSQIAAAALGAAYAILPSRLKVVHHVEGNDIILEETDASNEGAPDEVERARSVKCQWNAEGVESSDTIEFKEGLNAWLKVFEFIQEVLSLIRAVDEVDGGDVADIQSQRSLLSSLSSSILSSLRSSFLQNIFYPSILESSDDGSAVAILEYLNSMLTVLEEGTELEAIVFSFLIAAQTHGSLSRSPSHFQHETPVLQVLPADRFDSPDTCLLRDLLTTSIVSPLDSVALSALKLTKTLFQCHNHLSWGVLSSPAPTTSLCLIPPAQPPLDSLDSLDTIQSLIETIDPSHSNSDGRMFNQSLENYIFDCESMMLRGDVNKEAKAVGLSSLENNGRFGIASLSSSEDLADSKLAGRPQLDSNSELIAILLDSLAKMFVQSTERNSALTDVLATLARSHTISLNGWMTIGRLEKSEIASLLEKDDEKGTGMSDDGDDRSIDCDVVSRDSHPAPPVVTPPRSEESILSILKSLASSVAQYRSSIVDFDLYLSDRRQGLLLSDELGYALHSVDIAPRAVSTTPSPPSPLPSSSSSPSPSPRQFPQSELTTPSTPPRLRPRVTDQISPFAHHYRETASLSMFPIIVSSPLSVCRRAESPTRQVSVSAVLDNCILLEEFGKEMYSIVLVRNLFRSS